MSKVRARNELYDLHDRRRREVMNSIKENVVDDEKKVDLDQSSSRIGPPPPSYLPPSLSYFPYPAFIGKTCHSQNTPFLFILFIGCMLLDFFFLFFSCYRSSYG